MSDEDFLKINEQCGKEFEEAEIEIADIEAQLNARQKFKNHIDKICSAKYIDKIYVTPEGIP